MTTDGPPPGAAGPDRKDESKEMRKKLREYVSVFTVKNPSLTILISIFLLNIILFLIAATVISQLAPSSLVNRGFWASVFYTISMVLDAGCVEYVIADVGQASVALVIVCLLVVLIGMITFTGAVVGYVTNYISGFIENSRSGRRALTASGHTVILNWNSRASEIVNDLFYTGRREVVVVLSDQEPESIEREIGERLSATLAQENLSVRRESADLPAFRRAVYRLRRRPKNRVTVIVRQGDTYSTKQLSDISLSQAASVILLTKEFQNDACRYGSTERKEQLEKGNANTVKTLVQVAEMTAAEDSADRQTIIVEVEDDWTAMLVDRIIAHKERMAKCHIIPVRVNRVLGQILSQFSIMPELNIVYSELFSNRGAEFFYTPQPAEADLDAATRQYMRTHRRAIPLTVMETASGSNAFCMAGCAQDAGIVSPPHAPSMTVRVDPDYRIERKNVVIIGHNSKCQDIMSGFSAFRGEHMRGDCEILNITVVDDAKSLEKLNWYREWPYVVKTVDADIHDAERIKAAIEEAVDSHAGDTSLLILSDDSAVTEDVDSAALTYLIYVQDIIRARQERDPEFDRESIDVVVEILNPKNYDVVHNFSADNVVISNRYVSKMVTQIGRKQPLFEFYSDILTYDEAGAERFVSKELYVKEVPRFFLGAIPRRCTARELIWAVFEASPDDNKAIVLGYCSPGGRMTLFTGAQDDIQVELGWRDKLIVFSSH